MGMAMRKDFSLPINDADFLQNKGFKWNAISDGSNKWLIINNYFIPKGYNVDLASIALKIEASYPDVQIDMVYFSPALCLKSGKAIPAIANERIENNSWQRWSRHRTSQNPWLPGVDDISTHLLLVNYWLKKEVDK